jgi:RNA polymerase sigma factor (sigma-70 family)
MNTLDIVGMLRRDIGKGRPKRRLTRAELAKARKQNQYDLLLKAMLPFVLQRVSKYKYLTELAEFDYPDLVQEASLATMQAIRRWNPDKGAALTTMIKFAISGRMSRISSTFNQVVPLSIDNIKKLQGVDSWLVQDMLTDTSNSPEEIYQYLELIAYLDKHTDSLPDRQRDAVRLFCGLDSGTPQGMAKIAKEMKISPQAVKKLLTKGLKFTRGVTFSV